MPSIFIVQRPHKCRRRPIGGLRPPMPMLMSSMLLSLLRNSYGEIRHTGRTTSPLWTMCRMVEQWPHLPAGV